VVVVIVVVVEEAASVEDEKEEEEEEEDGMEEDPPSLTLRGIFAAFLLMEQAMLYVSMIFYTSCLKFGGDDVVELSRWKAPHEASSRCTQSIGWESMPNLECLMYRVSVAKYK
jgi:hypothetical protein